MESAPWMLIFPAALPGRDAVLLQLHRRRPARRARPEGPLDESAHVRARPQVHRPAPSSSRSMSRRADRRRAGLTAARWRSRGHRARAAAARAACASGPPRTISAGSRRPEGVACDGVPRAPEAGATCYVELNVPFEEGIRAFRQHSDQESARARRAPRRAYVPVSRSIPDCTDLLFGSGAGDGHRLLADALPRSDRTSRAGSTLQAYRSWELAT